MKDDKQIKQVFLFAGEDNFSAVEKANLWKEKFLKKYGEMNLLILEGDKLRYFDLEQAVLTAPFLSEKKLILVRDFLGNIKEEDRKKIVELMDRIPEYTVLVFLENRVPDKRMVLFKKLEKIGKVDWFYSMKEKDLLIWIVMRFKKSGVEIGRTEAQLLLELVGTNLWFLDKEIQKLLLYADGALINAMMIKNLVTINLSSSIFKMTDELGAKNLREVLHIFRLLVESGEEVIGIFFMLVRHFRIMIQVKDLVMKGMRVGDIARQIKSHPFVVSKMIGQIKNFSDRDLKIIYANLAKIDYDFKTGRIKISTGDSSEFERIIELMIVKLAQ